VDDAQQQLRTALAMGADRAILVETDAAVEPLTSARVLLKLVEKEQPTLVIVGKRSADAKERRVKAERITIGGKNYDLYPERLPDGKK
jgi:electron transfer flavoprotein beta subunit